MFELTVDTYNWIKALHVIFMVTWMAGLLYLPRLFVYHCETEKGSEQSETFKKMERRLLIGIIYPSLFFVLIFGGVLYLALEPQIWLEWWLMIKLILVFILVILNGLITKWYNDFQRDKNRKTGTFFRWINEIPAILMVGIIILVIVKPF